ncbi:ATP-binding cassette domain-containing protein [Actinomadura logoneensis]|uniref:ATP-binding cassette domain-containing protein n=1 Tax=Actinomadura logoneensis TaxID=2293572 RepID=A0A372JQX0_9ACTN|nr:ATP-binding cassette domain-containing protein [Actinomadura logoneensis]RFU42423.1 ATP-binding cassette domain-containing protein [Actinomadura logoneensis]
MRLDSVAFRYGRRGPWVLRDVSLTLRPGDIIELTGPNGAGKSTLLRLLAGLHRPRRGAITGRPASIGYAPERFPTDQPFTVHAYLAHMSALHGLPPSAADHWTDLLNLDHLLHTSLAELSKGSAQKVGFIQALLPAPALLLLDEPFSGLDATTLALLPELLASLAADGATIVISDHQRVLHQPEALPLLPNLRQWHLADTTISEQPLRAGAHSLTVTPSTPVSDLPTGPTAISASTESDTVRADYRNPDAHHTALADESPGRSDLPDKQNSTEQHQSPAARQVLPGHAGSGRTDPAESRRRSTHEIPPEHQNPRESSPAGGQGPAGSAEAPPGWTVLEVVVRVDEADDIERGLRAAGRMVRRVDRP